MQSLDPPRHVRMQGGTLAEVLFGRQKYFMDWSREEDGPIERVAEHYPAFDEDGDRFSTRATLRGSDWRGKDCNDTDATIYAGRAVSESV